MNRWAEGCVFSTASIERETGGDAYWGRTRNERIKFPDHSLGGLCWIRTSDLCDVNAAL